MAELNGVPVSLEQLQVLALTNYGHYTSMRVEDGGVRGLSLHLDRLTHDCQIVFSTELDHDRVRQLVRQAIAGQDQPVVVRVTIYDPELDFGHPGDSAHPHVLVTTRPAANQPLPPLRVASVCYGRELPQVKHIGLFGTVQQRRLTQQDGFDDALFVDGDGRVLEGATWNVGFYDGRRVVWPESACLPGITTALLNQVYGGPMVSTQVSLPQLPDMAAAFATNAAVGVRLIRGIDDMTWEGEHHILTQLRKEYVDIPAERL